MKTKIFKKTRHSLLVEEEDLTALYEFLKNKYKKIKITAFCVDGSRLESEDIEDILKFNNPHYRKIKAIDFEANDTYEERISLEIGEEETEFTIDSQNDEAARDRTQELLKVFSGMKPSYDLIARISVFGSLIVLWGIIGLSFSTLRLFKLLPQSDSSLSATESFNYAIVVTLIIFLITYPIDRFRSWVFPKVFFNLGTQKREMEKIKNWRDIIFKTILLGIVVGISVYFITRSF